MPRHARRLSSSASSDAMTPQEGPKQRMLSTVSAAKYLDMTVQHLAQTRLNGSGPPFVKVGRRVFYDVNEIDKWIEQNTRRSTSDRGQPQEAA